MDGKNGIAEGGNVVRRTKKVTRGKGSWGKRPEPVSYKMNGETERVSHAGRNGAS